ncbi:MAG: putative toxin-antitoxin system toxin component, PIN family [Actinomycetota bacterium]|nr:putative toxin-antitoxin system toxin component, PIN family [Actinomycetota bacterium]
MRAVLDPNVLISAVISPVGAPREILTAWTQGRFDLIVSPELLELRDVLARPKFRRWVSDPAAVEYVDGLTDAALLIDDPPAQPGLSVDPDDDYLIALARAAGADYLVSGDQHLTGLPDPTPPVLTPLEFRDRLTETSSA